MADVEADIRKHQQEVSTLLGSFASKLLMRAAHHDASKLSAEEFPYHEALSVRLDSVEYGSEDYHELRKGMRPALEHHYMENRHHPEHHEEYDGDAKLINDPIERMNLIDIIEMICDWMSASQRNENGSIERSISLAVVKYRLSPQLEHLLRNTVEELRS